MKSNTILKIFFMAISVSLFSCNCLYLAKGKEKQISFYLIKVAWHVGILIPCDSLAVSRIPVLSKFSEFNYIDIGWGDEDFYTDPDINYYNAFKAAVLPTPSVLKITGHPSDANSIVRWAEFAVKIKMDVSRYTDLLDFVNDSFLKSEGEHKIKKRIAEDSIIFYKSRLKYSLLYTCNTWVADALAHAGLEINPNDVITSDELFLYVLKIGGVICQ